MFARSVASIALLGDPDLCVIALTEFAWQAHRMGRAGDLLLLCDTDHGYGNVLDVARPVEELKTARVAGLSVEDTDRPVSFGGGKRRMISIEEGMGKMLAAIAARRDLGLVIAGRTSAPSMTSIADTIARAKACKATGVDAIVMFGV